MPTNSYRTAVLMLLKLADLAVVTIAFVLSLGVIAPASDSWWHVLEMRIKVRNLLLLAGYVGYWHFVLRSFGLYHSHRLSPSSKESRDLGAAVLVSAIPAAACAELFGLSFATPAFSVLLVLLTYAMLGTERRFVRAIARTLRRHGRNLRHAVIVGAGDSGLEMISQLARKADLGYRVLEVIDADLTNPEGPEVVARVSQLLDTHPVDELFVALPLDRAQPLIRALITLCETRGVCMRAVSSVVDPLLARAQMDEVAGQPVITIFTGPPDSLHLAAKRLIDVTLSTAALVSLAPLLLLVAVLVKLDSAGPVLFVQERVGLNGRRFRFFKFRTMVSDAEQRQAELESLNEADTVVFKIRNDPRTTRVGRWLRRTSLDELPQFLNVLKGDMSLVGPRPLPLRDVERIDVVAHKRRFSVKPGITCVWQVAERTPSFNDWVKTDIEYIDNWSLALDLAILLRTIPAVLSGRGAW